jgi:hypothetical protein
MANKYYILTSEPTSTILDDCVQNSVSDCVCNVAGTEWIVKTPDGVTAIPTSLTGETQLTEAQIIIELNKAAWVQSED